jgi:alpha-L-fucosidase
MAVTLWLALNWPCSGAEGTVAGADRAGLERLATVRLSPGQLAWQQRDVGVFIHFCMNTFTEGEWGNGQEDPKLFNPSALDCRQWCQVTRDLGAKSIILVAKHHDGFCLWPSRFTEHSVKASPWRNGEGDVVRELANACREFGLKFGIYLSAADLHHPAYGIDHEAYNTFYKNQLRELLTGYGDISEVWFDGASPHQRRQKYDYPSYYALIRELQPNAVIAVKGPDVRWVGNEAGQARESDWSVLPLPVPPEQYDWPDLPGPDLGSRQRLQGAKYLHWYPAQADVSIRPGWFYRPSEDRLVKSVRQLMDIYYESVGRNAALLINLTPDLRGLIPELDAQRAKEYGDTIRATFATNLLADAQVAASSVNRQDAQAGADKLLDSDLGTYWRAEDWSGRVELTFTLDKPVTFNRVMLQENIALGQRIERFGVDAWVENGWREIGGGTTVGYKRLLRLRSAVTTDRVRVRIPESRVAPTLAEVGIYLEP